MSKPPISSPVSVRKRNAIESPTCELPLVSVVHQRARPATVASAA